jgi:DNA-binding transcriptional LysR family regulator
MDDLFARSGLSFDRLRSLLAVADAGGLKVAAREDPKRNLRRHIEELEAVFALPLAERRGRGIVLTDAGRELAKIARETRARMREVASRTDGTPLDVKLGASDTVLQWWVTPNRTAFGAARLNMSTPPGPEIVERLLDSRLDFGIMRTSDLHSRLRSRSLGVIEYALYVPNALKPKSKALGIKELIRQVPYGVVAREPSFRARLDAALVRADVRVRPVLVCDTFLHLHAAVAAGRCAAVLPTLARDQLARSAFSEYRGAILGRHDGRMSLAWAPWLERQRPRMAALIPGIISSMRRP